jgi:hypothetical protein
MTKLWSTYFLDPNVQPSFKEGGERKTNVVAPIFGSPWGRFIKIHVAIFLFFFFFFFEPKS